MYHVTSCYHASYHIISDIISDGVIYQCSYVCFCVLCFQLVSTHDGKISLSSELICFREDCFRDTAQPDFTPYSLLLPVFDVFFNHIIFILFCFSFSQIFELSFLYNYIGQTICNVNVCGDTCTLSYPHIIIESCHNIFSYLKYHHHV